VNLYAWLTPEERGQLASFASPHRFSAGETLFYEGDQCPGLWVIGSGTVKITKTSAAGREIMLAVESAPSSVAEVPLFDGGGYPANVTAIRDTLAFLLHKDDFRRFCEQHPQVPLKVLAVVGKRLRVLVQLIETGTFGKTEQDDRKDFAHGYDFFETFGKPFETAPEAPRAKRASRRRQA